MAEDWSQEAGVVIVSDTLARTTWPGEDPIGKRIAFGINASPDSFLTVVGVVADVRDLRVDVDPHPVVYFSYALASREWVFMNLLVRSPWIRRPWQTPFRREIWEIDGTLPVPDISPLAQNLVTSVAQLAST